MANPLIRFIGKVCVQTAVYWAAPEEDGFGGFTFDDPIEILCRWDGKTQVITNANGDEVVSRAEVLVTRDLDEEGVLFLGSIDDLDSAGQENPMENQGAVKIVKFEKTPLFASRDEFVRTVFV